MGFAVLAAAVATTNSTSSEVTDNISSTIDQVGQTANLLDQYGPTVVILSVFLVLFIGLLIFILRSNHKMNQEMLKSQQAASQSNQQMMQDMFDTFKSLVINKDRDNNDDDEDDDNGNEKPKKKKIVSAYIDSSLAFKDASRIAIGKIKCERVAIYLFHNGNHTPYGYPFAKMSCVHEWTLRGSNTVRGVNHVNIPLYAFSTIVESLVKDGEFVVGNIYEHGIISADEQVFQFISGSTIRALFALGIKDKDGDIAAFTIAEFKDSQDFSNEEVYETVKNALQTMNDSIYSIVVNDEFRKNYNEDSDDSK